MGGGYLVEYQYEGNWYTVYRPEGETEESYLGEEREVNLVKAVPAGLFQITGTYRIYLTDLGYCEFTHRAAPGQRCEPASPGGEPGGVPGDL